MHARFIGGPHDGLEADRATVNQYCVVQRITTLKSDRVFVLMPPTRELWDQLVRGAIPPDEAREFLASWLPYHQVLVDNRVEFHFDDGGQLLSKAIQEAEAEEAGESGGTYYKCLRGDSEHLALFEPEALAVCDTRGRNWICYPIPRRKVENLSMVAHVADVFEADAAASKRGLQRPGHRGPHLLLRGPRRFARQAGLRPAGGIVNDARRRQRGQAERTQDLENAIGVAERSPLELRRRSRFARVLDGLRDQADAVAICGDIAESHDLPNYLRTIDELLQKPVYFVLGNHDFYRGSVQKTRQKVVETVKQSRHLNYLTAMEVVALTPKTALVGHDGWADTRLGDFSRSEAVLNDFRLIEELAAWYNGETLDKHGLKRTMMAFADEAARHFENVLKQAAANSRTSSP